jgi:hypothetical protein
VSDWPPVLIICFAYSALKFQHLFSACFEKNKISFYLFKTIEDPGVEFEAKTNILTLFLPGEELNSTISEKLIGIYNTHASI